jgi:hypothetical protein
MISNVALCPRQIQRVNISHVESTVCTTNMLLYYTHSRNVSMKGTYGYTDFHAPALCCYCSEAGRASEVWYSFHIAICIV